ncbi:MAG: SPASM domain-containing protein [Rhizobacter sp.]|nr:SPASM domain-containing protein [Chlorobiales bacterium]
MQNELLTLLPKVTPRRLWNAAKIFASYTLSKAIKSPVVWGKPISVSYEPTNYCNLRCPECPSGLRSMARPTGTTDDLDTYRQLLSELAAESLYVQLYFQGEPYLNPKFFEMVETATAHNLYSSTSTNAHYLTDEHCKHTIDAGLDKLIISIDGTTQQSYETYRVGGDLETVLEGTRNLIAWKKKLNARKPYTVFQFVVFAHNEHEVEEVKRLGEDIGVDQVTIKTAQVYDFKAGNALIPSESVYSRYEKQTDGSYQIKSSLEDHCWHLWQASVITWDGRVVPCCFDKDAKYETGRLTENRFAEIWTSEKYQAFRQAVLRGRKNIDICQNCNEGLTVFAD